jgi:flagellar motor switch protein FliG
LIDTLFCCYYNSIMKKQKESTESNLGEQGFVRKIDREKGYKKAAEFLILLGKEEAAKVLSHLTQEEIENLTKEIAAIETIKSGQAKKVLQEFGYLIEKQARGELNLSGGVEKAKEMLTFAFGEKKAQGFLAKIGQNKTSAPFSFLKEISADQIAQLVKQESAPVLAVLLSGVEPSLAAQIINKLDGDLRKEVITRIAHLKQINPEIIQKTADTLKKKLYLTGKISTQQIDGRSVLMGILKNMDYSTEKVILNGIGEENPELAEELAKKYFSMDVLFKIPKQQLQRIFRSFKEREIALLLKGKGEELKALVLSSVSGRRRMLIMEEYHLMDKILKSEADRATDEFIYFLRSKIEEGEVVLLEEDDKIIE